jgi:hypothetical protein
MVWHQKFILDGYQIGVFACPQLYKGKPDGVTISKSKSEATSPMPNLPDYSYANYCAPSPAVVYTRCEDEANELVQSLERYVHL